MEYETGYTDTSAGTGEDNYDSFHRESEEDISFGSASDLPGGFYSVGIDESPGLKENIADVHGANSRQVSFVGDLEEFLGDSDKYHQASKKLKNFVSYRSKLPQNAEYFTNEFINAGYINVLERLKAPGSEKELEFYENYAASHNTSLPEAVLFGPNGAVKQAYSQWGLEEALRGQHRSSRKPEDKEMAEVYDKASANTGNLPEIKDKRGNTKQINIDADNAKLPAGLEGQIAEAYGRETQLYNGTWYKGAKRLSGDLPYQLTEAMVIELLANRNNDEPSHTSKLESIVEEANKNGKDPFQAIYKSFAKNSKEGKYLKFVWDDARKILNDYATALWQKRDTYSGVIAKRAEKELPGTIYLNNDRFYWIPKQGEKPMSLVPDNQKNKLPGSLLRNKPGGYFWWIPPLKFRRRMLPKGEKIATKDLSVARKLQKQEWKRIQQYEPDLAAKVNGMKKWGVATKHKPTAVKIAKKYWSQIQENDPEMAARALSDRRAESVKPDIDKVWPNWEEQKARLDMDYDNPQMPIIYPKQKVRDEWKYGLRVPEKLESLVEKIKKVDWLAKDSMLVFNDDTPPASKQIAMKSNGRRWTNKQQKQGKRLLTQGSTSIDRDTGRIRFDVYSPAFGDEKVLAEEVYHVVFGIIREASPTTYKATQQWYEKQLEGGIDPTQSIDEAFASEMALAETGISTSLPNSVVKNAQKLFSENNDVQPDVIEKAKSRISA